MLDKQGYILLVLRPNLTVQILVHLVLPMSAEILLPDIEELKQTFEQRIDTLEKTIIKEREEAIAREKRAEEAS